MKNLYLTPYTEHKNVNYNDEVIICIRKTDFDNVKFRDGTIPLSISNCNFKKVTIENTEEISFKDISLAFFDCTIKEIEVTNIKSSNISLGFYGTILSGKIQNSLLKGIELNNCLLADSIFLIGLQKIRVPFTKENLDKRKWIHLFQEIGIRNYRQYITNKQSYYIYDPQSLEFTSNFNDEKLDYVFDINLSIQYKQSNEDVLTKINNAYLRSLSIKGSPNGKVSVENTQISRLYISEFFPNEEVNFYNITPSTRQIEESKIEIHKCNLDNVWFDNFYFNRYSIISFYRTKFSKTVFTACNFPDKYSKFTKVKPIENIHYPDNINENYFKDQYEIFIQMKKSLESTGNYYEAQKLQSIAHEALKRIKTIPFWDRVILTVNGLSNNHGLSIKRPLLLFLGFSILFYVFYLQSLGRIFNSNEIDYTLIGDYFSFIDLTHRTDFLVEKSQFTAWSLFFDFSGKLLTGFFAYQFIAAFRKYGKN